MTNLERLQMETKDITLTPEELDIYCRKIALFLILIITQLAIQTSVISLKLLYLFREHSKWPFKILTCTLIYDMSISARKTIQICFITIE